MCHMTQTTSLSGMTCHWRAGTCFDIKFEVSNYTHYKNMTGGAKCTKRGGLVRLQVTLRHGQCHQWIDRVQFPIRV